MKNILKYNLCIAFLFCIKIVFAQQNNDKPYIIVVSFDGFRWDYLHRGISPTLSKIANEGIQATKLQPCYPSKTFPNHISIMTGMYPENHGIISNHFENPFTKEKYSLKDSVSVRDAKWYQGEFFWETANRNNIKTASYFWPGSELLETYRRPSYFKAYQHHTDPDTILSQVQNWLQMPTKDRPHFITLYFHDIDDAGHRFGPNSSEVNQAIKKIDSITQKLLQTVKAQNCGDSVNFIFVSDHGMASIDSNRVAYIPDTIFTITKNIQYSWENVTIKTSDENEAKKIFNILKTNEKHFKVYNNKTIPKRLHFNKHPFIGDILIVPQNGWVLGSHSSLFKKNKVIGGTHGYDNIHPDMQGIFIASGFVFKNKQILNTIYNIDIYPLMCKIFSIEPRSNIDGQLERIKTILKNK